MPAGTPQGYAVFDVETTGLRRGGNDRIIEIAVVHLDPAGVVTGEWATLINPDRDLGPRRVHGITTAELLGAPSFPHVAGTISRLFAGRVPVAHNAAFDVPFLAAEYARLGVSLPFGDDVRLCTMKLAPRYLDADGRSLAACCEAAGVGMRRQHDALSDACAAAELLRCYLDAAGHPPPWASLVARAASLPWPPRIGGDARPVVRANAPAHPDHFLARLAGRLDRVPEPPEADSYLAVLDQVLIDRVVSATEAGQLVTLAAELGITRQVALRLHRTYLCGLAAAALEDGIVTDDERDDLDDVARLLGLSDSDTDDALAAVERGRAVVPLQRFRLAAGDQVVLTGEMDRPRDELEKLGRQVGLDIHANVTRHTAVVVAADLDSLSGKAKKARGYGIPVITESSYLDLLAAMQ